MPDQKTTVESLSRLTTSVAELVERLGGDEPGTPHAGKPSAAGDLLDPAGELCGQMVDLVWHLRTDPYDRRHERCDLRSWAGIADCLSGMVTDLMVADRPDEALRAIEPAVAVYRWLTRSTPGSEADAPPADAPPAADATSTRLLGRLAEALLVLAELLDVDDQRAAALAATEEAVGLRRRLGSAADLAKSLDRLSFRLGWAGRRDDARAAETEAVRIHQRLIGGRADTTDPEALLDLLALAIRLDALGLQPDAADARQRVGQAYQRLVEANPRNPMVVIAESLHILALGAGTDHPGPETTAALVTACAIQEDMHEVYAPTGVTLVYTSLHLVHQLWGSTDWQAVPRITDEFFEQADIDEAYFLPTVAAQLAGLSATLAEKQRYDEALLAADGAVSIRRWLADKDPDRSYPAFAHDILGPCPNSVDEQRDAARELAGALTNWAFRLSDLARHDEALAVMAEANDIRERHLS